MMLRREIERQSVNRNLDKQWQKDTCISSRKEVELRVCYLNIKLARGRDDGGTSKRRPYLTQQGGVTFLSGSYPSGMKLDPKVRYR